VKYYMGIDLGGTNIAVGVVDEDFRLVGTHSVPTGRFRPFEEVVADMARAARDTAARCGLGLEDFGSVGVGLPSSIHPKTGRVVFANNLGWRDAPFVEEFSKHIPKPIHVANDADCAALAESLAGAGRDYPTVFMVTLGTGLGGGYVHHGKLFLGGSGLGIEPGHITIVHGGAPCTCGSPGCLEAYASVTALIRETIEAMAADPRTLMRDICGNDISKVDGRTAFDAAAQGDGAARGVVERYIGYLATGLRSLITIFRPHAVVVGGGLCAQGETLLAPLRAKVAKYLYAADIFPPPDIVRAGLGNDAGIIGAALLETQAVRDS
jgi:glucokinase